MHRFIALAAASLVALGIGSEADASQVLFSFSGTSTISFVVDKSPVPSYPTSDGFTLQSIPDIVNGVSSNIYQLTFTSSDPYSIGLDGYTLLEDYPIQFYNNNNHNPIFMVGKYSFNGLGNEDVYSLKITDVAGAVPEPATWAMMLVGFGGVGFAMRRRSKVRTTVSYA
jgi:hypothetical protein